MKHQYYELKQMQSLPLELKVKMTQRRIREWYEHFEGQVYVSFSGGKDSTVLLDICRKMYPDIEAVYVDTGLEYPEIRDFVKSTNNVTWLRPKMNFKQVILKYGYPVASKEIALKIKYARLGRPWALKYVNGTALESDGRPSRYSVSKRWLKLLNAPFLVGNECCNVMKKTPAKQYEKESGKNPIIGTLACESQLREKSWIITGCNAFDSKRPTSQPLSFWTENDILTYLYNYKIPYCSIYGEIVPTSIKQSSLDSVTFDLKTTKEKRTGCMFCMFGCHLEKEPNKFQRMKETHPKQYNYCMKSIKDGGLGLKEVLNYIEVPYE